METVRYRILPYLNKRDVEDSPHMLQDAACYCNGAENGPRAGSGFDEHGCGPQASRPALLLISPERQAEQGSYYMWKRHEGSCALLPILRMPLLPS